MKFQTSDGVELDYQVRGKGQPVVLIEGFGGYQAIWQAQVDYLLQMNCQVITYDHRNHGMSQRTDKNLTIEQLTADLAGLITYLQLDKPILIGHSMGASVCYAYLKSFSNVKSVLAIDQSPKMLNDNNWKYGFENITESNFSKQLVKTNNIHETLHGLARQVALKVNQARTQYPFDRQSNLPLLFDHVQKDWRQTLLTSKIPISLVVAKMSPYFDYHFAEQFSKRNSKINSVVIDNCGHDIMAEVPEVFDQTLRHFIFSSRKK